MPLYSLYNVKVECLKGGLVVTSTLYARASTANDAKERGQHARARKSEYQFALQMCVAAGMLGGFSTNQRVRLSVVQMK